MTRVTLRLPDDLHQRLRAACFQTGVSLNQFIVATLNEAVARGEVVGEEEKPLLEQVRHIRAALSELVVELDTSQLPPHLRPGNDLPDSAEFMQSLPKLDPPLSATIIADREDRF
jgi:hypothetical protein